MSHVCYNSWGFFRNHTAQLLSLLIFMSSAVLCPTSALAQPTPPPPGQPLPNVPQEDFDRYTFSRAYIQKVERLKANRRLIELGVLTYSTEQEYMALTAVTGTSRIPVLLGTFDNTSGDPYPDGDLQQQLFDGPWATGTMTEYYDEISYGNLSVTGTVYDWVEVDNNDTYYEGSCNGLGTCSGPGATQGRTDEFITELIDANDGSIDFGDFDNDGPDGVPNSGDDDGYVDFIALVHPEIGAECGNVPSASANLWSHRWSLNRWPAGEYTTNDAASSGGNIKIDDYVIQPGLSCDGGMIEIGVFAHEFGHAFGLPDLYDTEPDDNGDNTNSPSEDGEGIGWWGLMGSGNWNSPERPAHMSAWSKAELGWITPGVVASDLLGWGIASSTTTPTAFKLWANGTPGTEYFLVEYRTRQGFDDQLRGEGLLVWHIDESISGNGIETQKQVDLESADQTGMDHTYDADDLDRDPTNPPSNRGDADDPFCDPGEAFTPATNPSSIAYNGTNTQVSVDNLEGCGNVEVMFADLRVGEQSEFVDLCIIDNTSDTCAEPSDHPVWRSPAIYVDNNDDGILDAPAEGIANNLFAQVRNISTSSASDVDVSFYYADPTMGLLFPSTATLIDTDNVPIIAPNGEDRAMVEWTIPIPPPEIHHYCLGVIAENAQDGQSSERPVEDNNVAQINIGVLYDRAGSAVPPSAPKGGAGWRTASQQMVDYQRELVVQACNPTREQATCQIVLGSPPEYDDLFLPDGWELDIDLSSFALGTGEGACERIPFQVRKADATHLDRAFVPMTLICNGEVVGGTDYEFNIDNVEPPPAELFEVIMDIPGSTGNNPAENAVKIAWSDHFQDVLGFPERVERWRIYRGNAASFTPAPSNLVAETALDENFASDVYEHFTTPPTDPDALWYKLVAVDRAGNTSEAATAQIQVVDTGCPVCGDVTGNGSISGLDASAILQFNVGIDGSAFRSCAADVTGNGAISGLDAANILQFNVGQVSELSCAPAGAKTSPAQSGRLSLVASTAEAGGMDLVLRLDAVKGDVYAVSASVDLNAAVTVEHVLPDALPENWQFAHNVADGRLRIALAGASPAAAGDLVRVRLKTSAALVQPFFKGEGILNEEVPQRLEGGNAREVPDAFTLEQNYPNPFNPETRIAFALPEQAHVKLTVYNTIGQLVTVLADQVMEPGHHEAAFNARALPSGVYFYRLEADAFVAMKRMVLLK